MIYLIFTIFFEFLVTLNRLSERLPIIHTISSPEHSNHCFSFEITSTFSSTESMGLSSNPNSLRVYGLWTATHSDSGDEVQFKWFALIDFNEEGKIVKISDYMDVTGVLMKLTNP